MLLMMSEKFARNMQSSQGIINYPTQLHLDGNFRILNFQTCVTNTTTTTTTTTTTASGANGAAVG